MMQRREFLGTLGAAAPVAVAAHTANAAVANRQKASGMQSPEPRAFICDDGRHAAPLYQFAPPLDPASHATIVDQLVGSGIDTLVYFAGLEGGVALYDSQVAQKWGDNVVRWAHPVWYRAARHIQQLIDDGHDPLKILCDRCHEKGIWFIASNWVSLQGGDRATNGGHGRKSDFVYDNPQFQVGEENDPRTNPARFSFLHAKVRRERFRVFEELLSRYETDGVELNLADFVPFCKFSEVEQLAPVMTQWLRELRNAANEAEQATGRRKRIYVRIPAHPKAWKALGYDVPTWVSENLVDGLMCLPGLMEQLIDQDPYLSEAVKLTRGTECRVLAACSDNLARQLERSATPSMIWAAAANAYDMGADGFGICNFHWTPNGWPWTAEEYQTLRLLAHPDMLATADKIYIAHSKRRNQPVDEWLPNASSALPQTLHVGKPVTVRLRIVDDLARGHALGKIERVRLRVRLTNIEPALSEVRIEFNGRPLPESALRLNDLSYRLMKKGAVNPYGFEYDYLLTPEYYPKHGHNTLNVTLVRSDPNADWTFDLVAVDCAIEYRVHRHFQREPISY